MAQHIAPSPMVGRPLRPALARVGVAGQPSVVGAAVRVLAKAIAGLGIVLLALVGGLAMIVTQPYRPVFLALLVVLGALALAAVLVIATRGRLGQPAAAQPAITQLQLEVPRKAA